MTLQPLQPLQPLPLQLLPIPAFDDNYFWLLHDGQNALVVDPGDALPVLQTLAKLALKLQTILVTHHHADHVGGVEALVAQTGAQVFSPAYERMPDVAQTRVQGGDRVSALGCQFEVLDVPGHTSGHIAYFFAGSTLHAKPIVFCGDTLFSGGCGRLFEGTPSQMLESMRVLGDLPKETLVCCAHEYTLSNLTFALAVEPSNAQLVHYQAQCMSLRTKGTPTLPSTIELELAINPFMRTHLAQIVASAQGFDASAESPAEIFGALRQWKNNFR